MIIVHLKAHAEFDAVQKVLHLRIAAAVTAAHQQALAAIVPQGLPVLVALAALAKALSQINQKRKIK